MSNIEWRAFCRESAASGIRYNQEAKVFLPYVLLAIQQFKWEEPSDTLARRVKTNISRILLDAVFDTSKRSKYSSTAVKFSIKALKFYYENKHMVSARTAKNNYDSVRHLHSFAEEMNCARAFYKFQSLG